MHRFTVPGELEESVESAARSARMSVDKWTEMVIRDALRITSSTPNPYVRGTTKPGSRPAPFVKPSPEHVLSTIQAARESLKHANASHSPATTDTAVCV